MTNLDENTMSDEQIDGLVEALKAVMKERLAHVDEPYASQLMVMCAVTACSIDVDNLEQAVAKLFRVKGRVVVSVPLEDVEAMRMADGDVAVN